jgi:hypothetical protein
MDDGDLHDEHSRFAQPTNAEYGGTSGATDGFTTVPVAIAVAEPKTVQMGLLVFIRACSEDEIF